MKYYLTFDVGTTAMKCILFDTEFCEIFSASREYTIETNMPCMAELSADVYFNTFCECTKEILDFGVSKDDILTITFTTQGETLIPVDFNGEPLCKAIVWLDTRAELEAEIIANEISKEEMYKKTGLYGIDGALPAAKILWIYRNYPKLYDQVHKFLLLEDYLIFKLTGKYVSEQSLQSSTGWYNIVDNTFYEQMLNVCKIDANKLPKIMPCGKVVGGISNESATICGLSSNTVVTTGAMDQISSAVGIGNVKEGMCTETTGTALVVGVTTEKPNLNVNLPITVYKHFDSKFIYMPYSNTAGITLKWFKEKVMPYVTEEAQKRNTSAYDIIDKTAEKSPAGSKGVIMLPQLSENGAFLGLTLATETSDLARSVLEGVAYMLRGIIEQVEAQGVVVNEILSLGGGSYSKLWCSIKADICKKNIICTDYPQTTSLGAAILAALAIGQYSNIEEAFKVLKVTKTVIEPNEKNFEIYDVGYQNYNKFLKIYNEMESSK